MAADDGPSMPKKRQHIERRLQQDYAGRCAISVCDQVSVKFSALFVAQATNTELTFMQQMQFSR
jgi:hypothetical protein